MRGEIRPTLFLLSVSARAYACRALSNYRLVAIDGFADSDLTADEVVPVPLEAGQFTPDIVEAVATRARADDILVYGSGFEARPELLDQLNTHVQVLGNSSACLELCADPYRLMQRCEQLDIPCPPTQQEPPADSEGWLLKHRGRSGGGHVRDASGVVADAGEIWQRRIDGVTHSALFLAANNEIRILGINRLLESDQDEAPYAWSGAIAPIALAVEIQQQVQWVATRLAREFDLLGMGGFDFIINMNNSIDLIDLNPRMVATCELYEEFFPEGCLATHVQICLNRTLENLPAGEYEPARMRGMRPVYAPHSLAITPEQSWPEWCSDLPAAGTRIAAGQPLCTVHGENADENTLQQHLRDRQKTVLAELSPPVHSSGPSESPS